MQAVKQHRRVVDYYGRPWECGDADRPGERWAAYGAYDEPGAVHVLVTDQGRKIGVSVRVGR